MNKDRKKYLKWKEKNRLPEPIIRKYSREYYEYVFPVEFEEEIWRATILIVDEDNLVIGYNTPYKSL